MLAPNQNLGDAERQHRIRGRFSVALRNGGRCPTHQLGDHGAAARLLHVRNVRGHVDGAGQVDHAANGQRLRDEERALRSDRCRVAGPHGEVPPGGVAEHHNPIEVQLYGAARSRR